MIKIERLTKYYGKNRVLHDIDLAFEKGRVYGVVGANGAGKTTLFRCIAGLEKYDGEISYEHGILKNHLGLLFTEPFFFAKMTGREYIQLLCDARSVTIDDMDKRNIFGLPLNQYADTYSTGMKKKLALTAILLQGNDIFILDEPFNGVDIQSNIIIADIIKKLKELNKTVVISSHIFSTLSATCDEIQLLKNGVIARKVLKAEFDDLEAEMREITVGDVIGNLGLE